MKIAFFDCFSGISGDMSLGALVDAGADIEIIKRELKKIPISGYRIEHKKVTRAGISSKKVDVVINNKAASDPKKWKDIEQIIKNSTLSEKIREKGLHIFKRLFEAEANVHGETFENVHLHELGGIDCIIDIFGSLIGFEIHEIEEVYTSPINLGSGSVKTTHGILPVPAPATTELLKGYPVYYSNKPFELTTPTGAAIISGLDSKFSTLPEMIIENIGYGAGNKDFEKMPNVLRLIIGRKLKKERHDDSVMIIETNIDDMNPQIYEDVMEKLFNEGAIDVFLENIIMKKGRPAVKLNILAREDSLKRLTDILFKETTTIGVRFYKAERRVLDREIKKIKTRYGDVRFKLSRLDNQLINISPEYDDLKSISKRTGLPIKRILEEIIKDSI